MRAIGTFEVKMTPLELNSTIETTQLGRMSLEKEFNGDLAASSRGEMLTAGNPNSGSAGYVAVEQVSGLLHGRKGSFLLQHNAIMNRGKPELNIVVVPDSGTDELEGITGSLEIVIAAGGHSYIFEYTLPEKAK